MKPSVYTVVLNWNGWQDTIECLESLIKTDYPSHHILVIDNNSCDGSVDKIREWVKDTSQLTLIQNSENLGFAGGNNVGIRYAMDKGAEYIFLLNNDTVTEVETISSLVEAAEEDSSTGIVGSLIFHYPHREEIWFAGGWINWFTGRTGHYSKATDHQKPYATEFISGCALMIKGQVVKEIGLLDEDFFLYFEDTDWCMRARNEGYGLKIAPQSRIWHKVSVSTGSRSPLWQYYTARNMLLFMSKHNRFPSKAVFNFLYPFRLTAKLIQLLFSERSLLASYIKANDDFWKGALGKRPFR